MIKFLAVIKSFFRYPINSSVPIIIYGPVKSDLYIKCKHKEYAFIDETSML